MRVTVTAGPFASALHHAAAVTDDRRIKIEALRSIRLTADSDKLTVASNILDFSISLSIPAVVIEPGMLATSGERLASLVAAFPHDADVMITNDGNVAHVTHRRSRYRLPTLPPADLPAMLALAEETGHAELSRVDALRLLARPLFAVNAELSRTNLNGILLQSADGVLVSVATDGHRLARVTLSGITETLSATRDLIIPTAAIRLIIKLLADRAIERVTLRRSHTLFELAGPNFVFTTKRIDGVFPDYARVVPQPSDNFALIDHRELLAAVLRVKAVTDTPKKITSLVGLQWGLGQSGLRVCAAGWPDLADDQLAAETGGAGVICFSVDLLREQLGEIASDRVRIDPDGGDGRALRPALVADPDDASFVTVLCTCVWPASEAAA